MYRETTVSQSCLSLFHTLSYPAPSCINFGTQKHLPPIPCCAVTFCGREVKEEAKLVGEGLTVTNMSGRGYTVGRGGSGGGRGQGRGHGREGSLAVSQLLEKSDSRKYDRFCNTCGGVVLGQALEKPRKDNF